MTQRVLWMYETDSEIVKFEFDACEMDHKEMFMKCVSFMNAIGYAFDPVEMMNDMTYKMIPVSHAMYKEGDNPIFGDSSIRISVDDEAAGPFVRISQCNDDHSGEILLNFDEIAPLFEVLGKVHREWAEIDAGYE